MPSDAGTVQPKPSTLVAAGDFYARAALTPNRQPQEKEQAFEQARRAYQQALQGDPKYLPAQIGLARCYVGLNDMDRARAAYEKALEMSPNNPVVWHDLSVVYLRLKNWDTALSCLDKAITGDPENRQYQNTQGWALARAGRTNEALACFTRLHGEAQAHYKLARMLDHTEQKDQALKHIQMALQLNPGNEDARKLMASMTGAPGAAPGQSLENQTPIQQASVNPNLPPQVQPIRTTIYQEHGAMPPANAPRTLDPSVLEPQPTMPPAPVSYQLPPDLIQVPARNSIQPAPPGAEPVHLIPPPPRTR